MYDLKPYLETIDRVIESGPYKADWDSLAKHSVPAWFRNGKFGIFIHWGVYSVPGWGNEWYSRNMYLQGSNEFKHHIMTYGEQKDFGYKDFIPMFKAENFSAEEWMTLFEQAGARYVVPVAEHHDGFQMYKSEISHWNAFEMGPKRDVLGELTQAAKEHGIVNCASTHRIEHFWFMGCGRDFDSDINDDVKYGDLYWPSMPEPKPNNWSIHGEPYPTKEFLDDWMVRTCEIIDKYKIHQLYFDWWIIHSAAKPYLKKIAAYYYNRAAEWGEEVMIAYKSDAYAFGTAVVDIERGKFGEIREFPWQTDTAVGKWSWGYTENNAFKNPIDIVRDLVDIVSKNGCMLLNIGPKPDGTIADEDKNVLLNIGNWLKSNGEAIYETRCYKIAAEGPTKMREGMFTDNDGYEYTAEDFRFTRKGGNIYAIAMNYPADGKITIKTFSSDKLLADISDIKVLGFEEIPIWSLDVEGLHIETKSVKSNYPIVFRVELK